MDESLVPSERRIVFCKEIDADTALHMTVVGERYTMRRFDGTDPFEVTGGPDYSGMRRCYRFAVDRPLTTEEMAHPVEDQQYWSSRIAEINEDLRKVREG